MSDFEFQGLDELAADIAAVVQDYPDETSRFMQREANRWKKAVNTKGYDKYTGGKRPIPKAWKNLKEENILHVVNQIEIVNSSPLFHLLENGHRKWLFGRDTGGFVSGKHWAEQTREEWRVTYPEDVKKHLDKMLGGRNL